VKRRRDGERGLSIIEAIVIATITALLALMILPLLPRASESLNVAEQGVDEREEARAERDFRALVRAVSQREIGGEAQTVIEGGPSSVLLQPSLAAAAACAPAGAPVVQLNVENGALSCLSNGRRRALLRWPNDNVGALSYSVDGVSWLSQWSGAQAAPYVRFELRQGRRVRIAWIERVSGEPS
jgi:hypothetical protein